MKLHKNDRSNKSYISLEILSFEVFYPYPGVIYMYKIKKHPYKIRVQISFSEINSK